MEILNILLITSLVTPMVVTLLLGRRQRAYPPARRPLVDMAIFLTLKPYLTVPLIVILLFMTPQVGSIWSAVIPDATLTVVLVFAFRGLFRREMAHATRGLLFFDVLRWFSLLLAWVAFWQPPTEIQSALFWMAYGVALTMPAIFAVAACFIIYSNAPPKKKSADEDERGEVILLP